MSMMSMKDAHSVIQQILGGPRVLEMPRLERIHNAMRVDGEFTPTVCMPPDAPRVYAELARKSHTDFLRLIIKEFSQAIRSRGTSPRAMSPPAGRGGGGSVTRWTPARLV